ncbi:putative cytoplasmic protein [Vibrio sp. JCM 18904]|nr:putative cytoplasmic protein [Vibrio sp. JCM 18904]GAJ76593.1 putative cytoplasmic protein [Vibrio sp. JCM 18905]
MLEKENLIKLARMQMPFGKYAGRVLIDLPEEYLLWFDKKGWPSGELGGDLLKLCLALKIEGLDSVVKPLKRM